MNFTCPTCSQSMQCPDHFAGKKATCPKCGQKILIPTPPKPVPMPTNKTTLGKLDEDVSTTDAIPVTPTAITAPPPLPPPEREYEDLPPRRSRDEGDYREDNLGEEPEDDAKPTKHSGLGIASFLISLLVIGLDVILVIVIVFGIAGSRQQAAAQAQFMSGGLALVCLNCMSIPLCLVGAGLGLVALVAHREQNNLFSWIGVVANSAVIFGVVTAYILVSILGQRH
jgi:DNA-directed RNA polymerase subunit RPC12/RpoP